MHKLHITYDQLLEAIQEGIWLIDADSITTYANKKMADMLGYTVDEMIGKHLFDFIDEEELAYVKNNINSRKSGVSETHESRFKHKEGYDVFAELKTTPVTDDEGNYFGAIASVTDITTLKKSKRLHQTVVENIPDIIIKYDKAGVYLEIIAPGEEKLFAPKDELLGKKAPDVLPKDASELIMKAIEGALSASEMRVCEYQLKVPEGLLYFEARIVPDDGNNVYAFIRDITARRQAEQKLQFQAEILDSIGDLVTATDPDGKIVYVNEAESRKFGKPKDEIIGKTTEIYGEDPEYGALQKEIVEATNEKGFWRGEVVNYDKDNNPIYLDCRTWAMRDADGFIHTLIGVSTDITERKKAEKTLRKSEQELRTVTDNMTDVVSMADIEGRFTYLSKSNYQLTGYKPEELIGKSIFELIHEDDLSAVGAIFQEGIVEGRKEARYEYRVFNKNNHYIWIETIGSLVTDDNGNPSGALFVSRDISDRKQVEDELQEQKNLLKSVFQSIQDGISILNTDLTIREVNYSVEKWYEHQTSLIGKKCYEVYMNRSEPCMPCPSIKALEKKEVCSEVVPLMGEEKQVGWGELYAYPLIDEATGSINGVVEFLRDITDRKKAEEALYESEEKYRSLFNQSTEGIYLHDLEGRILDVNDMACLQSGYSREELLGLTVFDGHPSKSTINLSKSEIIQIWGQWEPGERYTIEAEHQHKDGTVYPVEISTGVVRHGDKNVIMAIVKDITERKQVEEKIRYLGFHDQLTDLYNRYYFESCKEELKNIPLLSVIMTDINGLKLINDTYGHKAGDELLKKYAELLRKSFKRSDLIFRWGGDEFIIILKNTQEAKSWELCNRLIKHCGETFVKDIPLSISVGISSKLQGGDIDKATKEAEDMMYKNKLTESKSSKNLIMKTLLHTLSEKSFETKGHIDRMTTVSRQFGEKLDLLPSELSRLEALALLHDVGKINIDSTILLKETALTDAEWEEIKKHPEVGYRITRTTEEFAYVANEILAHHERWDGKGYPQGLEGEDIPYLARLLNIIDSFDVMSNGRPYKKKMTYEEIIEEIKRCSGKQFDPSLAEMFIEFLKDADFDLANDEQK